MGGVAVLNPQDVLKDRLNYNPVPLISPLKHRDRKPSFISNSNSNPKTVSNSNSNRRKRSPQKKNDVSRSPPPNSSNLGNNFNGGSGLLGSSPKGGAKIENGQSLVMGKVKILKRGEALTKDENDGKKLVVLEKKEPKNDFKSMEVLKRIGPEPDMLLKQTRLADFYAGSGFVDSPDPSLLPVPSFFKKGAEKNDDDYDSIRLRSLLNLAF